MESPSGRACDDSRKRWRERIAPTISSRAGSLCIVICVVGRVGAVQILEDLLDPVLAGDRVIVQESELRRAFETQTLADLPAQERGGALERLGARRPRLLVAERGV